jgi:broad specificity phosphatase PhoE
MRLYFVRHGESEANVQSIISNRDLPHPLTELGRQQARRLAQAMAAAPVTRIYSSPVLRARQTAEILSRALGAPVEITDALREFDCGIAEGRSDAEAWTLSRRVVDDWLDRGNLSSRIEGGESFEDLQARFLPFVERLVQERRSSPDNLILLGHGGLFSVMLPLVLANVDAAFVSRHSIVNTGAVVAEAGPHGLACLEWCGEKLATEPAPGSPLAR